MTLIVSTFGNGVKALMDGFLIALELTAVLGGGAVVLGGLAIAAGRVGRD